MARFRYERDRLYIQRRDYIGANGPAHRWEVLHEWDDTLYAYALTWFGAWRLACAAVGWKVPT